MTEDREPAPGRTRRWLIGCGIGCAALLLVVSALVFSFSHWIRQPGELLRPERLLGARTTGFAEWTLRLEDPGTEGFVDGLIRAAYDAPGKNGASIPSWMNGLLGLHGAASRNEMKHLFPVVLAWKLEPGPAAGTDRQLVSLGLKQLGNRLVFIDWMLGLLVARGNGEVDSYRSESIYLLNLKDNRGLALFLSGSDLFFTSDLETAREAVDRLLEQEPVEREATSLERLFAETTADRPLRGALSNGAGEIGRLWAMYGVPGPDAPPPGVWDALRGVTLDGGLESDGSLAGTLELHGPDRSWAAAQAGDLGRALAEGLAWTGAELAAPAPVGDRIRIDFRVPRLVGAPGS